MNINLAKALIRDLPIFNDISGIEFLDKGYSADRKYLLFSNGEPRYLLRVSDISEESTRRSDFDLVSQLWTKGIACPQQISFGVDTEQQACFIVQNYVSGDDAESAITALTTDQQYALGIQAGKELRKIHHALSPSNEVDWFEFRSGKYRGYQQRAEEMGISYEGQEEIEQFIQDNVSLLQGRPTRFCHGDFHPGNLVIRGSMLAGIIDFNRCYWGDPYFEFYKLAQFGAPLSAAFARGQVDGYFPEGVPGDFWPLYNVYVAMVLLVDIVWTQQKYPQEIERSHKLNRIIKDSHDFIHATAPKWYISP